MAQSATPHPRSSTPPLTPLDQAPEVCNELSSMRDEPKHIWLLTGPAGCGKSTLGKYLANVLGVPFIEGDEFHPKINVEKMSQGIPLTDADRWDWLVSLRQASLDRLVAGHHGVVLTCSALKRKYRDVIRVAPYYFHKIRIHFFYLDAPESVLLARVKARKSHFMGANMVHSQFTILEPPDEDEKDVSRLDVGRPLEQVQEELLSSVLNSNPYLVRKKKSNKPLGF
ncbi:putative gluconokinase [Erysiphe necator]|uniref:Gluconokinase n=1 Tax=Uncinula necator TaxID=52586 RepID=A0A0B1PBZ1_UNCNE|nr:putative gluconokinase [Erysiphe necator]KHJ34840.1 putative related to thermoresistant gluconokinase [Erysiphe necator]